MELRIARHTDDLKLVTDFYTQVLGLQVLFSFENHNDYSGVMLGKAGCDWHLEFTISNDLPDHQFDEEDILVFYPTEKSEYQKIVENISSRNIKIIKAKNPFWDNNGIMIKDPDGFGIIVSNMKIK